MKKRGIIVRPSQPIPYRFSIDPEYLRYCLLYWDEIDCPDASLPTAPFVENRPDLIKLHDMGVIRRTRGFFFTKEADGHIIMRAYDEYPEEFWAIAQLYAFQNNNQSGEIWSVGHSGNSFHVVDISFPDHYFFVQRPPFREDQDNNVLAVPAEQLQIHNLALARSPSLEIELYNSLPVPTPDTDVEAIIDFRESRRDELHRLRHAIDTLYLEIINSRDIPRSKSHAIEEIDQSLRDLTVVMKDRGWRRLFSTIKVKLDLSNLISRAALGGVVGHTINLPAVGALIGAATSVIKFSIDLSALKPASIPENLRDYQYLYQVKNELSD